MSPGSRLDKLKQILEKRPDDSFARYGLAMEFRNLGNLTGASEAFSELVRRDPDYVAAYYHYGMTLRDSGRPEEAEEIFLKGLQAADRRQDAHAASELQRALEELRSG